MKQKTMAPVKFGGSLSNCRGSAEILIIQKGSTQTKRLRDTAIQCGANKIMVCYNTPALVACARVDFKNDGLIKILLHN